MRDHRGDPKWYGAKVYPRLKSSLEAEAVGLVWAMSCVDNLGLGKVIFESESKNLVQPVKEPNNWLKLQSFTSDINQGRRTLQPSFCCIGRSGNSYVDVIATKVANMGLYFAVLDCLCPE